MAIFILQSRNISVQNYPNGIRIKQQYQNPAGLNDLRMSSLIPCAFEELAVFDKLIAEHQMLHKNTKK